MDLNRKNKILLIDDEEAYHEVVSRILSSDNYEVDYESDGSRIINTLLITQPDLIILDWHIPGYDSTQVIEELKYTPGLKHIPIIVSTSMMAPYGHVESAIAAGAIDYIRKPFDQMELKLRLQTAINSAKKEVVIAERKNLEQLVEVKDKLLSVLIHDIRNPIQSLVALTELLKSTSTSGDNNEIFASISDKIKVNLEFIDSIFSWSKGYCQEMNLEKEQVDLSVIIKDIIKFTNSVASIKNIHINAHNVTYSPVHVDCRMIRFVLRNLISNAIKFSYRNGRISINMEREDDSVAVTIQDEGRGITPSEITHLFEMNYSTNGVEKEVGHGLGLYLSKEFLECNGGSISVESVPREYTMFTIRLPLSKEYKIEHIKELVTT